MGDSIIQGYLLYLFEKLGGDWCETGCLGGGRRWGRAGGFMHRPIDASRLEYLRDCQQTSPPLMSCDLQVREFEPSVWIFDLLLVL